MLTVSRLHKIRFIKSKQVDADAIIGVTIPPIFSHWVGVMVSIRESGNSLILESGTIPVSFSIKQIRQQGEVVDKIKI